MKITSPMAGRLTGWRKWLFLGLFLGIFAPGVSLAGIAGSRHDFSGKPIAGNGVCTPCHRPHAALDARAIWVRSLAAESAYFKQTTDPNYIPTPTLLCYDCHDDSGTAITPAVDGDPPKTIWIAGHEPQDIAFTDGPPLQGGTQVGYYELSDGNIPDVSHPAPTDGSPTGGHYWKDLPSFTSPWKRGDKIPCNFCHDPHRSKTGTNEAFFLTEVGDGSGGSVSLGDDLRASQNTRYGTGDGRAMCAACHSYANSGSPVTLWGVTLPKPPASIPQHLSTDSTACTICHKHNDISRSCHECHGNPPLLSGADAGGLFDRTLRPDAENYAGGAGAHRRHKDALGEAIFHCEICHGPNPGTAAWHNQGNGTVSQGNVDIIGQKLYWDPTTTRAGGYDGNAGVANPDTSLWEFTAKAKSGGDQRCFSLACHGDPPNTAGALNWTDRMVDDDTGAFIGDGGMICAWCHDATPAVYTGNGGASYTNAPNVMGNGGYGAEVNGHGLAATAHYDRAAVGDGLGRSGAGKACTVCHEAGYQVNGSPPPENIPRKTHFDGSSDSAEKRLRGTINGQAVADSDGVCAACHLNAGADAGTQVSHHGNSTAGGYTPLEGAFTRVCRQCHEVHGASWNGSGRNLYQVGTWLDLDHDGLAEAGEEARVDSNAVDATVNITAADNAVVFTSRTGDGSFDALSGASSAHICSTCHAPTTGDGAGTGGGDHAGTTGYSVDQRGNDCTQCHDHDFDGVPATADAFVTSCRKCHGNPPLLSGADAGGFFDRTLRPDAGNYPGGAGAHRRHRDALGEGIFTCGICHGPTPGAAAWHNQGNGTVSQGNVDLIGQKIYWDPTTTRAGGYDGNAGVANPDTSLWEFTAKAKSGGDQRCFSLACHGDPPNTAGALNWTDRMVDDDTGAFIGDGGMICAWCHDATPAVHTGNGGVSYTNAPNVMGNGGYGAEVNGHGLAATAHYDRAAVGDGLGRSGAGKACTVCHEAGYQVNGSPPPENIPRKTHFDGSSDSAEKRLRGTINGQAVADSDGVCAACHQNAGAEAGTQASNHGNSTAGGYTPLEGSFTRVCRQCHEVHGASWNGSGRNLYMVGAWLDLDHDGLAEAGEEARVDSNAVDATVNITAADNAVVFTSRTGAGSFDPLSGASSAHICSTCHAPATGGGAGTGGGDHAGTTGYSADERGNDCTQCHGHNFDSVPATADAFMPAKCESCHNGNPSYPLAPNIVNGTLPSSNSPYSYNWYGTDATKQDGGHGDPQGRDASQAKPACTDCHDLSQPPGNLHFNGIYDSVWNNTTRNANTAHLKAEFFTAYPANTPGTWSIQVAFDRYCYRQCHIAQGVTRQHVHTNNTSSTNPDQDASRFGTHGAIQDGDAMRGGMTYPIDRDLNTNAIGPPTFATCVSCHDPHGTTVVKYGANENHMLREEWALTLCNACH